MAPFTPPHFPGKQQATSEATQAPLQFEIRSHINTETAAFYLSRKEQTLRMWACYENGPIRPIRINKRLAWPVAEIRKVLQQAPE